ncbi:MAG: hypothetical protein RLZ98_1814 [Pseudomonadota bacterium]|jgi:mannose-6-phosphate isomerase-like protein (cupin superfamily)
MGVRFIFMLTRDDRTVPDASDHLQTALAAGVHHIGFKDVGLPVEALRILAAAIRIGGATSYLEVVSLDRESEVASAKAAVDIGVDVLLGGTRIDDVLPIIAGTQIEYYPFPGRVNGHPSILEGNIDEIAESAGNIAMHPGVHGLDLLAWRSGEDVPRLIQTVCNTTNKPVIVAGSINGPERIQIVKDSGAAGFTIGTAALNGEYPADKLDVATQLAAIMRDVATINRHISAYSKQSIEQAFAALQSPHESKVTATINDMTVTLARYESEKPWHYHPKQDQMFLVHKGRLLMRFRDREETLEEGELIVVPHGVEHCPVPLTSRCEIVRVEPRSIAGHPSQSRRT